jgi:hypothetical protein
VAIAAGMVAAAIAIAVADRRGRLVLSCVVCGED